MVVYISGFQPHAHSVGANTIFMTDKLLPNKKASAHIDFLTHEILHKYLNRFYEKHKSWFRKSKISKDFFEDEVSELLIPIIQYCSPLSKYMVGGFDRWKTRFGEVIEQNNLKQKWKEMNFKDFVFYVSKLI